ncbi:MAG: YqgE/AlgH family protein, partial [Thermodesulfobacteriota bacterium]
TVLTACTVGAPLLYASFDMGRDLNASRRNSSEPLSKGMFLVARGVMKDPHFHKTVIYLISYNALGAKGIVVNRPSRVTLSEALPQLEWLKGSLLPLSWGGPVEDTRLMLLALTKEPIFGAEHIKGDLYAGGEILDFKALLDSGGVEIKAVRAFGGYAGWAPGQLDLEVARGWWRVIEAPETYIFRETDNLWFKLTGRP